MTCDNYCSRSINDLHGVSKKDQIDNNLQNIRTIVNISKKWGPNEAKLMKIGTNKAFKPKINKEN